VFVTAIIDINQETKWLLKKKLYKKSRATHCGRPVVTFVTYGPEVCRIQSTGVDFGRSWCFSAGAEQD